VNRRNLLKSVGIALGGAACSTPILGQQSNSEKPILPFALPIRALVKRGGKLFQPIRITLADVAANGPIATKLDGVEVDRRTLTSSSATFEILVPPVATLKRSTLTVEGAGAPQSCVIDLQPVRRVMIYILNHSHHDLGYTDLQADVEEKQMSNIRRGIELARKTASYPEAARFVWNLEVLWAADLFLKRRSEAEKKEFLEAIQKGWIGLNGSYANELTGLCRPEELLQLFRFGTKLGSQAGVKVDSAMMSDVPGFSWGTVAAMSQAGIRYFSAAPNYFDRIGTFMKDWQDKPFWWVSPSGKEKILMWVPWTGYAMSSVEKKLDAGWVGKYQDRLDTVNFPYDISYIRWSGHGDNAEPDPDVSEFVHAWNDQYAWPKFTISSTSTAFSAFEKEYGRQLPSYQGDLTPYWEDGAGSSALETRMSRNASDRLTQAAAMHAISEGAHYDSAQFDAAWRDVLLYSEHTWGAWNSVSDSENPFVTKQWDFKRNFASDAQVRSEQLLTSATESRAAASSSIDVWNTTPWIRSGLVLLSKGLSVAGDRVTDSHGKPVPSQRLATGELGILVKEIPPFASARYTVIPGKPHPSETAASIKDGILQNGMVRAKVDLDTGNLIDIQRNGVQGNLIDTSDGKSANEYIFLAQTDFDHLGHSSNAKITVEEDGPLVACLRIDCAAPGTNSLVRRIRLFAGADHIELSNIVDKKQAALNPHPGNADQGGDFAQHGSKESIQFAFPFHVPGGTMEMNIPLAVMQPEKDQLPGSCKNWLPVGSWVDVSSKSEGITWVTLDAPLVEIGEISATMLGSQKDPTIWRKHIAPTQTLYSWVMNNHWGTNYRAYQVGPVEFRYALRPHSGDDLSEASRFADTLTQPLVVMPASKSARTESMLRVEPEDVSVIALKPSDDGKAWIIRLLGNPTQARDVSLRWTSTHAIGRTWRSNLAEERVSLASDSISIAAEELITLRVERT
jgi:alpha-mannosidase